MRAAIVAGSAAALLLLFTLISYISFFNTANRLENSVKAQFQSNKNGYDSFWKKVTETAQVPDKYKEDFKEVLVADNASRYGKDGSGAVFQWLTERQVQFDSSQYKQLMTIIESGRNSFKQSQDDLLDKQRVYANHLGGFMGRMWAGFGGFPRAVGGDLAPARDMDGDGVLSVLDYKIVTSGKTEAAFQAGEDEALDVFGKKGQ